jgi:hypothetical protein
MKTIAALSLLGAAFGLSQPTFAQAMDMDPLPWSAQLGVCGACLTLVGIVLFRTLPRMAAETRQGMKEAAEVTAKSMEGLTTEVHGMRADNQRATESTLELLQDALKAK